METEAVGVAGAAIEEEPLVADVWYEMEVHPLAPAGSCTVAFAPGDLTVMVPGDTVMGALRKKKYQTAPAPTTTRAAAV